MYLVFDTETTGFPLKDKPADYPGQARIVQLAALLLDENFKERACLNTLIRPSGWTISAGAQQAHGITQEDCQNYGVPIEVALKFFDFLLSGTEVLIAHNISFDNQLLNIEYELAGVQRKVTDEYCTMHKTTNICKLQGKQPGKYKWPKLEEAYWHFFSEKLEGAHDALVDVRACARIYKRLQEVPSNVVMA